MTAAGAPRARSGLVPINKHLTMLLTSACFKCGAIQVCQSLQMAEEIITSHLQVLKVLFPNLFYSRTSYSRTFFYRITKFSSCKIPQHVVTSVIFTFSCSEENFLDPRFLRNEVETLETWCNVKI
jgi:hypothetical protein